MKFLLVFFITYFNFVFSQETKFPDNFSFKRDDYKTQLFDVSKINVFYKFEFINDPKITIRKESVCLLQIGNKFSKFSDYNSIKKDSLMDHFSRKETVTGNDLNLMMKFKELWPVINLKNINDKKIIYHNQVRDRYQYEEKQPVFTWNLEEIKKNILGYTCRKATTVYRGRTYIAWYTLDIPKDNGPYIFEGLPGLILEISDDDYRFHFLAVGISKTPSNIYMRNENSILKVTRDKFRQIQKTYYENPAAFHGKAYDENGNPLISKSKPIPYNPMELE